MRVNWSRIVVVAVAVVAVGVIATSVAVASAGSGQPSVHGRGAGESAGSRHHGRALFSWFQAGPAPAGWRQVALPGGGAVLSYPGWLGPVSGDAGTVSRGLIRAGSTSVLVAAAPAADWTRYAALLERAVSSYTVT
jgi:hypothetical protein